MLAAIEAVAQADAVWPPPRLDPNIPAQAPAGESLHAAPPSAPAAAPNHFARVSAI